jgi:diguanylate cyclase (GGDEF)-like protein/PAS domain S-box-containing protein
MIQASLPPKKNAFSETGLEVPELPQANAPQSLDPHEAHLAGAPLIGTGLDGIICSWNEAAGQLFGYSESEAKGQLLSALLKVRLTLTPQELLRQLMDGAHWIGETGYRKRDGSPLVALSRWWCERDLAGQPGRIMLRVADTTLHGQIAEAAMLLRQSERPFHSLFDQHPDGVVFFSLEQRLTAVNPALCLMTGYAPAELLGMPLARLVAVQDLEAMRDRSGDALQGKPQICEFVCVRKDGSPLDASITMLPNLVDNRIVGVHGIVRDISHRKHNERRIRYLATHDPLTGLPNRNMLDDRMQHAIDKARRFKSTVGVLFMDMNGFKAINDTLGHDKGDMLLCAVADRLRAAIRESDTVARIGGDEFVVVLETLNDPKEMKKVALNILRLVRQPVKLDRHTLTVTASIGGSVFPRDGEDRTTLMKRADIAMYEAKKEGEGAFCMYTPDLDRKAAGRAMLETRLRYALEHDELVLHYQPRLDVSNNRIVGVEALVRWEHPENGLLFPSSFIPLAEEAGLIDTLGACVLLSAARQLKDWQEAGLAPMKVSINISAHQLKSGHLQPAIRRVLEHTGLDPECLDLEITESSLTQNLEASLDTLKAIRKLGVSLSIDHFGTGYSSLSYLKQLPVSRLKIDKLFIKEIPENRDDAAIVMAAIAMAHSMSLKIVAEGVTSLDQVRFLQDHHCDELQGYLLCQPLPPQEAESFFKTCSLRGMQASWAH